MPWGQHGVLLSALSVFHHMMAWPLPRPTTQMRCLSCECAMHALPHSVRAQKRG